MPINVHGLQLRIFSNKIRRKIYKEVRTSFQNAGGWHFNFHPLKVRARRVYWTMPRTLVLIIQRIKDLTALIINLAPLKGITSSFSPFILCIWRRNKYEIVYRNSYFWHKYCNFNFGGFFPGIPLSSVYNAVEADGLELKIEM